MKLTERKLKSIIRSVLREARTSGDLNNVGVTPVSEEEYTPQTFQSLDLVEEFEASGYDIQDFAIGRNRNGQIEISFKVDCEYSVVSVWLWHDAEGNSTSPFRVSIRSATKSTVVDVPVGPSGNRTQKMDLGRYYLGREWYGQYYCYDNTVQGQWVSALERICALSEIPPQERPFKDAKTMRSQEGKALRAAFGNVTDRQFKNRPEFKGYYR